MLRCLVLDSRGRTSFPPFAARKPRALRQVEARAGFALLSVLATLVPVLIATIFAPLSATADDESLNETPVSSPAETAPRDAADLRFSPGFSISTAGLGEERTASGDSLLFPDQDGETTGLSWSIAAELELLSPVLAAGPLRPRVFVRGGGGYVLDPNDPVSSLDDPGSRPFVSPFQPDPLSAENQGAAVKAQAKPWVLTGGIGSQIEFEFFERTIYLRPSLEWMYRKDTIQAIMGVVEGEVLDVDGNCAPCRVLFIDAETEKGYHSLGIGLESGIDVGRMGPLGIRFFASGRVYHVLGDRKAAFSPEGRWELFDGSPSTRDPATTAFNARYEREPIHYRAGVGLRMVWQPE